MPAQGALPPPGLIETLRWEPGAGFNLLEEHLARLAHSSVTLGYRHDPAQARAALRGAVSGKATVQRVRLQQEPDGSLAVASADLTLMFPDTVWRAAIADVRLDSRNALLAHKTTRRDFYDDERARLAEIHSADEAVFLNERGELCEGGITSLFVPRDGVLLTPPLSCGLLAGVLRAHLLAQGRAREAVLQVQDLAGEFFLGNSLRGLIRARLV